MSEKLDIGALRSIASVAPRGSWSVWTSNSWCRVFADQRGKYVTVVEPTKQPDGHVDLLFGAGGATFLETFTTDTVGELLDQLETSLAQLELAHRIHDEVMQRVEVLREQAECYAFLLKHHRSFPGLSTFITRLRLIRQ
jgi:hypothetical protein